MDGLRADAVAQVLRRQHGINLVGVTPILGGQPFIGVRPTDLEGASGFQILLARSPFKVSASFVADTYAGRLIREMSQADDLQRQLFRSLINESLSSGFRIAVEIDGAFLPEPGVLPSGYWQSLDIEVQRGIPRTAKTMSSVEGFAINTASLALDLALCLMELEPAESECYLEGTPVSSLATRYERNPRARARCIAYHGRACSVCGFDFGSVYGSLGENFIEVHHIVPISSKASEHEVDPLKDLIPVCSNCHRMIHKQSPPIPIEELRRSLTRSVAEAGPSYNVSGDSTV